MSYSVPDLPYPYDALEPHIDAETMRLHHDKHHQAYVDKLNAAVAGTDFESSPIDDLLEDLSSLPDALATAVRNQGGGHANHTLFWESMSPDGGGEPTGELAREIAATFDSFDAFRAAFENNGVTQFGSGWTWLVLDGGELKLTQTANQDSPLLNNQEPLLGNDVWEHAYYLTYRNRRPDYLKAWWNIVNWRVVEARYEQALARAGGVVTA